SALFGESGMSGKDPRAAARWRGWLISVVLHGAAAGLIFLAARASPRTPGGAGLADTRAPDQEITITVWDEPARVGPKEIKPILVNPPAALAPVASMPPLFPVPPTPSAPIPAVTQIPKAASDPNFRPAVHNPPAAPVSPA